MQVGINLGYILEGLYASLLFGKLNTNINYGDFRVEHNANTIGGHLGYAIFSEKSILARALLWRGLTVQTGFIHTDNKVEFYNNLDERGYTDSVSGFTVDYTVDPSINFEIETSGEIIPVELYTSIRILWFLNIGVGGGFDYVFASRTDFGLSSAGDVTIEGTSQAYIGEKGTITVESDTSDIESDKFRPKLMANLGFGIGPVFIDVPASYYLDNGYAIGLSAGFVW